MKFSRIDEKPSFYDKIRNDGSRIYNLNYANQPITQIRKEFSELSLYSMSNYKFSNNLYREYGIFVDYLKLHNIKVILVFSPYHPEFYEKYITTNSDFLFTVNIS